MSVNYEAILGQIGEDYVPIENIRFETVLGRSLIGIANELSEILKANLDENQLRDSDLKQSIVAVPISVMGNDYYVGIQGNEYAFFVNSGVNGLKTKHGSIYSFRTRFPSEPMVKNLMRWITKKGIPLDTRYSQTRNLTKKARAKVQIDEKRKRAFGAAVNIKKDGIKPTYFMDAAISDIELNKISSAIANKVGKQVMVSIDITFQNDNNNRKS
jgi:hypothetical protein